MIERKPRIKKQRLPLAEKDVASIKAMAGYGLTVKQIADVLGMSKKTLERRMHDSAPELGARDAMDQGRSMAIATVSQTAYDMAISKKEPGMTQFWLQCRGKWKKTDAVELTGKDGEELKSAPQVVVVLPDNSRG